MVHRRCVLQLQASGGVAHLRHDLVGSLMTLVGVGVVLLGDSFPVQSIRTSEFQFSHRPLRENLRLPVAVQADNDFVVMQILPERFEVNLKRPDRLGSQLPGLEGMVDTFLEYVGRRTVRAVGHNISWSMDDTAHRKSAITKRFTRTDFVASMLGSEPLDPDLSFGFKHRDVSEARLEIATSADGDAGINFNFHFDATRHTVVDAVSRLNDSITKAVEIAEAIEASIAEVTI